MLRSASSPTMMCLKCLGSECCFLDASKPAVRSCWPRSLRSKESRCSRIKSRSLCSPSPGTFASDKITSNFCHAGSVATKSAISASRKEPNRSIKSVPGVMTLESHDSVIIFSIGNASPRFCFSSRSFISCSSCSSRSRIALTLRPRCCLIFAAGATPSIATYSTFCGLVLSTTTLSSSSTLANICSSDLPTMPPLLLSWQAG
mmetsp:Transcript_1265/g.2517  ORF Transcript_1265/g.2517 Transcript_1265/m.2517 type:complete len:203 (+) Transcript_1265:751-1359(+)